MCVFVCVMWPKTSGQILASEGQYASTDPQISPKIEMSKRVFVYMPFLSELFFIRKGN